MSDLKEEEKNANIKNKKEKKPITMKKLVLTRLLFIIVFSALVVGITFYLADKNASNSEVVRKTSNVSNNTAVNPKEDTKETNTEKTVDLDGTYDKNPIQINYYTMDISGNEIKYVQIDGLKDNNVEIDINYNIKKSIEETAKKLYDENPNATFNSGSFVRANFANILSINAYVYAYDENDSDYNKYEDIYFNYNLIDGTELTIDDVFTSDCDLEKILIDKLYEVVTSEHAEMDDDSWEYYVPEDAEDIEEIVYSIVSDYQRGKKINFYITPQRISVRGGEYSFANILFKDYSEYVTIYDKYLTSESIYDGKYSAMKDLINLSDLEMIEPLEYYIEESGKDYYINIALYSSNYFNISDKVIETMKVYIDDYVSKKKSEEREDGIFRIYNMKFDISEYEEKNYVYVEEYTYDTTKSKYNNSLKNEIKEFFRRDFSDYPEHVGNAFLIRLNYYEPIMIDGETEYEYHEIINEENVVSDYYDMQLDEIGNIIYDGRADTILEVVD